MRAAAAASEISGSRRALVALLELLGAGGRRGLPAHRDVRVLGHVEGVEPALLGGHRQLVGRHGQVGREHGDPELHRRSIRPASRLGERNDARPPDPGRHGRRRHRRARPSWPTSACATAASSPSATRSTEDATDDRSTPTGPRRRARLRRPAHPLRRPALLGPVRHAVERARRDDGRSAATAASPSRRCKRRRRRLHAPDDGQGRGHAARRARAGRRLELGDLRRVPRPARRARSRVNAGFLVGHCALRRYVMGADAVGSEATPEQIDAMVAELGTTRIEAGGARASPPRSRRTHSDGDGNPVASPLGDATRSCSRCARTVGEHEGTTLEGIVAGLPRPVHRRRDRAARRR